MSEAIRVGVLGDFNPNYRPHHATNLAIDHAASRLGLRVHAEWLPTPSLLDSAGETAMARCEHSFAAW